MMKNKDHLTLIAFGFILVIVIFFLPNAKAQIGQFEISVPQIVNPPKCSTVDITGNKAYIPFQIKVFHEFSRDNDISFKQIGSSIPNTNTSPQLMIFSVNAVDEYQIHAEVNHDTDRIRAVYIEIWSQNNPSFKEVISYEGVSFCRNFNVVTSEATTLPTREELIGEAAITAFEEMPLIKNAINDNTTALNQSIIWMFMVVVGALAVSAGQFFAYIGRRRKDKKRGTAFDSMIKVGSNYISDFKKEHTDIKKQRTQEKKQIDQFLDMANVEFRSFLVDLRKEAKLPEKASLEASDSIVEDAEQTSILRKVYESTSDDNIRKFINFFKNKSGKLAKRHQDLLTEESEKRIIKEKPKNIPEKKESEILSMQDADAIIVAFGKERYRNLTDAQLRHLYRAFNTRYSIDPQEKYSHRLYKISEILNIRAKERANGTKK